MNTPLSRGKRRQESGFWFVAPALLILGGFGLAVTLLNVWYSLQNWSALSAPTFAGFKNYERFIRDSIGIRSLLNTFQYALMYVFPTLVLSLALAMGLNHKGKQMSFFRALYYVPVITSYVVVIVVWQWFFDYDIGLFNSILGVLGFGKAPWLLSPAWSMPSLVLLSIWKNCGYTILMFLAGLQTVDENLYEAAAIDGSGRWQMFWHITLPQLKPTTTLCVVMVTTWSFQMFVQPYLLTGGGPNYSTMTITYYLYQQAFSSYNIGYGSAIAVIGVAIFLVIVGIEKRLMRERG